MHRNKLDGVKHTLRGLEGIIEVTLLSVCYYLFWRHGYNGGIFPAYLGNGKYVLTGVYALLLIVFFRNFEGFQFGYLKLTEVLISQWIALFITNFITYFQLCLIANKMISPVPMMLLCIADAAVSTLFSYLATALYHHIYMPKRMVMICGSDSAVSLKSKMDSRTDKYCIEKLVSVEEGLDSILAEIVGYDAVIINDVPAQIRNDILKFCYKNSIRLYVTPKISDILVRGATDICLFDTPLLLIRSKGLTLTQRMVKRVFDVILCLIALIVASPIMLVVAIAIKCEDGGPVFYKQKRATLNGKVFDIMKFRSMIVNAEKEGVSQPATDGDPRITKVGRIIRATRIDELPQILNILKGDMSIVGPRPERVEHVQAYTMEIPEFEYRLKVKGGLTGYAQIYGKYNTSAYDKLRLDLMYIENYSFLLDLKLILQTIRIILSKESTEGFKEQKSMTIAEAQKQLDFENGRVQEDNKSEDI